MQKLVPFRKKPVPEPEPVSNKVTLRDRLIAIIEVNLLRYPFVQPMRILWNDLQSERNNWPLLLFLAFVGWRTYRVERKRIENRKRK
jgi:hypothetical protein